MAEIVKNERLDILLLSMVFLLSSKMFVLHTYTLRFLESTTIPTSRGGFRVQRFKESRVQVPPLAGLNSRILDLWNPSCYTKN
jgi:hypothetical protein